MTAVADDLITDVMEIAQRAGQAIVEVYQRRDQIAVQRKEDQSPVTEADLLAHQIICQGLQQLTPKLPILSEEAANIAYATRQAWTRYWLVDPLDGTKEFIHGNDEFTVNIALIEHGEPVLGVVGVPVTDAVYYATAAGGAFLTAPNIAKPQALRCRKFQVGAKVVVVASRRHGAGKLANLLQQLEDYQLINSGSSLKFCRLAEGNADLYPRFAPTSEWDTAAAHCILRAAGGEVFDLQGQPLRYNTKESLLNPEFLAVADTSVGWLDYCK